MSNPHTHAIQGELSIYRTAELRQWLDTALPEGGDVHIDLAEVSEIDTAGAQLLLAGKRLARDRRCRLSYVNHSAPVLALVELFNLAATLGDPIVLAADTRQGGNLS